MKNQRREERRIQSEALALEKLKKEEDHKNELERKKREKLARSEERKQNREEKRSGLNSARNSNRQRQDTPRIEKVALEAVEIVTSPNVGTKTIPDEVE